MGLSETTCSCSPVFLFKFEKKDMLKEYLVQAGSKAFAGGEVGLQVHF